jgi:hypothetical protein
MKRIVSFPFNCSLRTPACHARDRSASIRQFSFDPFFKRDNSVPAEMPVSARLRFLDVAPSALRSA